VLWDTTSYLDNSVATRVIKHIFSEFRIPNSVPNCRHLVCSKDRLLDRAIIKALARQNLELFKFFVSFLPRITSRVLSAAVQISEPQLIEHLLKRPVEVDGLPDRKTMLERPMAFKASRHGSDDVEPRSSTPLFSTPLAEAIRLGNKDLVKRFEDLGALSQIHEKYRFEEAISAAAWIGDSEYIQMLLHKVADLRGDHLFDALMEAMLNDKTDAAFMLLEAGATVNPTSQQKLQYSPRLPLREAINRRNSALVEAILECDINVHEPEYMAAAASWGIWPLLTIYCPCKSKLVLERSKTQ
jgi:hypothetical protein